jgi:hypothetical protein
VALDLTLAEFVAVYPHFRNTTTPMFEHARRLALTEVSEALFGAVKGKAALIELVADQLDAAPGADDTRPRVGGGVSQYRENFERIRASLGPFSMLV